ncbi:serine/threonine-protein phosphatase 7 long form homolog [Lycium ferocissimum]|uniref:serine/threonine-protein phosphatase 7 long form homolog n=1 Tax=Lycium ferocissimum TaxID=112874 RepID=UPI0028157E09|nr:serine/threonine-protein phosphatase 7 long form homolog [Lycium ferocissimum]
MAKRLLDVNVNSMSHKSTGGLAGFLKRNTFFGEFHDRIPEDLNTEPVSYDEALLDEVASKNNLVWAWERITVLRPQILKQRDANAGLPRGPRATRWFAHFSWTKTTQYVLKVFRDALDSMTEDQFIWEPYSDELIESLPDYCRVGRNIWRARVTIFCWDVVEVHLPDRVMRQFGMIQEIPPTPFPFDPTHFNHDRRGRPNTNWELEHAQWLPFWHQRLRYVINAPVNHEPLRYDDPTLFGSDALLVLLLVILLRVLSGNKVMCLMQRLMKQW